ncbi:hypothetical protein [Micromonospora sp. NPDC023644]|uniref:hypothetical protein n=1 Tax=Micromonospora sp. NPDC023644 TaxID=3154321 RepID=UPI003404D79B
MTLQEGFLGAFRAFVGNGLLIFRDVNSIDAHVDYAWDSLVHAAPDSVYVGVQNPIDGPVLVDLYEEGSPELAIDGAVLFDGNISSLQGQFFLHDPLEEVKLQVTTDRPGQARLLISADEDSAPAVLRFQIWY